MILNKSTKVAEGPNLTTVSNHHILYLPAH